MVTAENQGAKVVNKFDICKKRRNFSRKEREHRTPDNPERPDRYAHPGSGQSNCPTN